MEIHSEYAQGWRGRGTLKSLVTELERQKESKVDFVTDARGIKVACLDNELCIVPNDSRVGEWLTKPHSIHAQALPQIGARVSPKVSTKFTREFAKEWPHHAADFFTRLLHDTGGKRLIRCLDGNVRAFLSNSYRILDNYDMAFAAMDVAKDHNAEVFEASLSEQRMRIKFMARDVWEKIDGVRQGPTGTWYAGGLGNQEFLSKVAARTTGELPGGPGTIWPVVTISNSETGHGGMHVRIGVLLGACFNLATVEEVACRIHLGERQEVQIFSEKTQAMEAQAIMAKACDAVRAAFNPEVFKRIVDRCRAAQAVEIANPSSAVENFVKTQTLIGEDRKDDLLRYFVDDYEMTAFGFAQSVSRVAQDVLDPDTAAEIEELAGVYIRKPELVMALAAK